MCAPGCGWHPEPLHPPRHAVNQSPTARRSGHLQNESGSEWRGKPRAGRWQGAWGWGCPNPMERGEVGTPPPWALKQGMGGEITRGGEKGCSESGLVTKPFP